MHTMVSIYRKLQFHNHQNLGFEQLPEPLSKDFDTEGAWIAIPDNVSAVYRRLLQVKEDGKIIRNNHFEGLAYALKNAAMMVTMTEREDIGTAVSGDMSGGEWDPALWQEDSLPPGEETALFFYDQYEGGLGYADKIADFIPRIIDNAITLVSGCPCENGCAACIGDHWLDKSLVLWGLKNLLEESAPPEEIRLNRHREIPSLQKPFLLKELGEPEKWMEFCTYLKEKGDPFASFLSMSPGAVLEGNTLSLSTANRFYRDWIMEKNNYNSLLNIFRYYTQAPGDLKLEIRLTEKEDGEERKQIQKKLEKGVFHG